MSPPWTQVPVYHGRWLHGVDSDKGGHLNGHGVRRQEGVGRLCHKRPQHFHLHLCKPNLVSQHFNRGFRPLLPPSWRNVKDPTSKGSKVWFYLLDWLIWDERLAQAGEGCSGLEGGAGGGRGAAKLHGQCLLAALDSFPDPSVWEKFNIDLYLGVENYHHGDWVWYKISPQWPPAPSPSPSLCPAPWLP